MMSSAITYHIHLHHRIRVLPPRVEENREEEQVNGATSPEFAYTQAHMCMASWKSHRPMV